ncbi:hypothetical protein GCM10009765_40330 [Fodinicola feengrottensis]|uniref:SRPBCC family protein n=1 Tax=Fodinicola feengrottensis TaxID=435914 RepID=A0ABN2HER2_9ACTN
MISLKVITATTLPATPGDVWPLLVDSRMDRRPRSPVFYLGVPRPVECALPSGVGGVGAARECRAAEGVIRQRITRWQPASVLEFRMQETDLPFRRFVAGIAERFELMELAYGRTARTRTTTVTISGPFPALKAIALGVGLKSVHRFVFSCWRRQSGRQPASC